MPERSGSTPSDEPVVLRYARTPEKPTTYIASLALFFGILGGIASCVPWIGLMLVSGTVVVAASVIILQRRQPTRYAGSRRAVVGVCLALVGLVLNLLLITSHEAAHRSARRAATLSDLRQLARTLQGYADMQGGQWPSDLQTLVDLKLADTRLLHAQAALASNRITDFHYVSGLDASAPKKWILAYADPSLFKDRGGGVILYVDGTARVLDAPAFDRELQRFRREFGQARGYPPTIIEPR